MYSPRGMFAGCSLLFVILACLFVVFIQPQMRTDLQAGTSDASISMVQPGGHDADLDYQYSQVNQNNAEANHENAQAASELARATAIVVVGNAQAEKLSAESCDIRNDCNSGLDVKESIGLMSSGAAVVLAVVVVGFVLFVIAKIAGG